MQTIPVYISLIFGLTVTLTFFLLIKAAGFSKPLIAGSIAWLLLQAVVGLSGFYTVAAGVPPRFAFLILPPLLFILIFLFSKTGRRFSLTADTGTLTLLHIVRVPVEIVLYLLMLHKAVPEVMTFEGRNFDILCGISAPVIYYFGYKKKTMNRSLLVGWNILCLLLLANIVVTAVLSAPFRFQQFGFDQPNVAFFYFPFIWLPCFVVPVALFAHLVCLRRLIRPGQAGPA